jgi:hypothetical protein
MADGPYKVTDVSQTPNASKLEHGSESTGDKLRGQKGNNPDYQLRSQSVC